MLLVPEDSFTDDENTDEEERSYSPLAKVERSPETSSASFSAVPSRLRQRVEEKRTQLDAVRFAISSSFSSKPIREYEKLLNVIVYADAVEEIGDAVIIDALLGMMEDCWEAHFTTNQTAWRPKVIGCTNPDVDCGNGGSTATKKQEDKDDKSTIAVPKQDAAQFRGIEMAVSLPLSSADVSPRLPRDLDPLHTATPISTSDTTATRAEDNHSLVAQYLQERGGCAKTAWLDAARQDGRLDVVQYVSEHCGAAVNISTTANAIGYTALHLACAFGHVPIVEYLIQQGVDVNVPGGGSGKETALHIAIESQDTEVFDCLVASGKVDMNAANAEGETAWLLAGSNGFWHGITYLLEQGHANINDPLGYLQETVLHVACQKGDLSMVQFLIALDADAEACNRHGETALHVAVRGGFLPVVRYLIETCRVNALARSGLGSTALLIACAQGDLPMVQYLLNKCPASVLIPNVFGRTPLQVAEDNGHRNVMCCLYGTL